MTPSNTKATPEIKKVIDSGGDGHTVIPTPHNHSQSEVSGLADALAAKASASDTTTALSGKADKVSGASNNNLAALDGNGNLKDSGKKASDFADAAATTTALATKASTTEVSALSISKADKVTGATNNNLAALDSNGNLKDSGKNAADFMPAMTVDQTPTANSNNLVTSGGVAAALEDDVKEIKNEYGTSRVSAYGNASEGYVEIGVTKDDAEKGADITYDNIENLINALQTPDSTPTANSTKLVTSGGVKAAIDAAKEAVKMQVVDIIQSTEFDVNDMSVGVLYMIITSSNGSTYLHTQFIDSGGNATLYMNQDPLLEHEKIYVIQAFRDLDDAVWVTFNGEYQQHTINSN